MVNTINTLYAASEQAHRTLTSELQFKEIDLRFIALDQTRGLAITAMILAHFGPGIYERIGLEGWLLDLLLLMGRLATPTFIAIFGITLAFVYVPKAAVDPIAMRQKLIKRSGVVLLAAIAVSTPEFILTFNSDTYWANSLFLNLLLNFYGILTFYVLAIFSCGLIIGPLSAAPYAFSLIFGSTLIFVGSVLGYDAWPSVGPGLLEWFRFVLVSGKYAYLVNLGCLLMLVAFGSHLKRELKANSGVNLTLLTAGIATLLCGLAVGRIVGWRTVADLHSKYDAPPQLWYLSAVIGTMFLVIALFNSFKIPAVSFIMEHTGRNPLSIYVAHAFVLPAVAFLRFWFPFLPDALHTSIPMLVFLLYWTRIIYQSSRS